MSHSASSLTNQAGRATLTQGPVATVRDYIALTKPSINRLCLIMTAGGLALAPSGLSIGAIISALLGTAMAVASANALNMWWERDTDRLMKRTADRPLAARRISERGALIFGLTLGVVALAVLALGTNALTTLLGALALGSYVLVYTPMKYKSPLALVVGAIPGAAPPLMGWTAATGQLDPAGLALFATLLAWQIPHFIAIATFRRHDYAAAGIQTLPNVRGMKIAKIEAVLWSLVFAGCAVLLTPIGVTSWGYGVVALVVGVAFTIHAALGFRARSDARWGRQFFLHSLIALPVLVLALVIDVMVH